MADRIRSFDWAGTPLGPAADWPAELRASVEFMLASPLVAAIAAGPSRIFLYNDTAAPLYGHRHPDALGRPLPDVFAHEFDRVEGFYDRVFGGESMHVPMQELDPAESGMAETFEAYLAPVRDGAGQVIAVHMTGFAAGNRLRAEKALRESEQRMKLAVAASGSYGWEIDFETRAITPLGDPVAVLGFDMPGPEGDRFALVHPDDAERVREVFDNALAERTAYRLDHRLIHPVTGETVWLRVDAEPFEGLKLTGVVRNITAEKRTEEELRESRARQAFLLALSDALRPLDDPGAVQEISCRLLAGHLDAAYVLYGEVTEDEKQMIAGPGFAEGAVTPPGLMKLADLDADVLEAYRAGRTVPIEDLSVRPRSKAQQRQFEAFGMRASIGVPLIKRGRFVAGLGVYDRQPRAWSLSELATVEEVAQRTWAAVERARAEARLRESEDRQAFLLKLSDALRLLETDTEIMETAAARLGEHLGVERVGYGELDADASHLDVKVEWRRSGERSAVGRQPLSVYGAELIASNRAGKPWIIDNVETDPRPVVQQARDRYLSWGVRAAVSIPLIKRGAWTASLYVNTTQPRCWTDNEIQLIREVTERTWIAVESARAEAALRESETLQSAMLEVLPIGLAMVRPDGRVMKANPEWSRFVPSGQIPSTDAKRGWRWRSWDEEGQPVDPRNFPGARALRGEHTLPGIEFLYTDDSGEEIWTRVAAVPVRDTSGKVGGAVSIIHNIDAEKRAIEDLRASEERLRQFGEASQDVLWLRDPETLQWRYLTPAFETIYGLSREEALSGDNYRSWLDLIVPEDRAHAAGSIRRVGEGEYVTFEYRIRRPSDGSIRRLRDSDFPITGADGKVILIGGTGRDITEEREIEERFRILVEGVPQLVWRAVDGGHWTWASPQWTRFTGQSEKDSHGFGWLDPVHPDDRAETQKIWSTAIERGRFEADYRLKEARSGAYRWFQTRATPVRNGGDTIVEWLGTSTDVHELRELEERQRLLVAELQHRVRNILTVVRSVFGRTAENGETIDQLADHFRGRLDALARTQVVVTQSAGGMADLESLIRDELLSAVAANEDVLTLDGPEVTLPPQIAESLGLALHELTTNAIKYGALSVNTGKLSVSWRDNLDQNGERRLNLCWLEQGVPAISTSPTRKGFGTELIEEALPYRIGAESQIEYRGGGLRCTISVPLPAEAAVQ